MTAKEKLAAAMKEIKGLGTGSAGNDPPPSSGSAAGPRRARARRKRCPGAREFERLQATLHASRKRARSAERSLARLRAASDDIWRLNQRIARIKVLNAEAREVRRDERLAAKLEKFIYVNRSLGGRLGAARQRIGQLEAENEQLRKEVAELTNRAG